MFSLQKTMRFWFYHSLSIIVANKLHQDRRQIEKPWKKVSYQRIYPPLTIFHTSWKTSWARYHQEFRNTRPGKLGDKLGDKETRRAQRKENFATDLAQQKQARPPKLPAIWGTSVCTYVFVVSQVIVEAFLCFSSSAKSLFSFLLSSTHWSMNQWVSRDLIPQRRSVYITLWFHLVSNTNSAAIQKHEKDDL